MGIPWRSAESMHWQLGEQEMSARANAPVFQLHPSATPGPGISSPPSTHVAPATHGFTPTNAAQLIPNAPPPLQQHQLSQAPPQPGPIQSHHHRTGSSSSQGRRRNSSFSSRRRAEGRSRSSVPPQLGPTLPQIQPKSEADLVSGARTAPAPEIQSGLKREGESAGFVEPYQKRRREEEDAAPRALRPDPETRSQGGKSPDRLSQRSGTGSVKSMKREAEEVEQPSSEPPPATAAA